MARWLCVICAALLLPAAASAAPKKPHFYRLGIGDGPAVTDGQRYVAFLSHKPSVAVYDFGAPAPHETLLAPPTCFEFGTPDPGAFAAIGAGKLGWTCYDAFGTPMVTDLASGASTEMSGVFGADGQGPVAIGRRWAEVFIAPHADPVEYWYYDLAAQVLRRESSSPREYPNLDKPRLFQRMCGPLRRTGGETYPNGPAPVYDPYFYAPPYGVGMRSANPPTLTGSELITVERCGSRRVSIVGRCSVGCVDVGVSAGIVTWTDSHTLHAYILRTRRHYSWAITDFGPGLSDPQKLFGYATLTHTRQRLIASIPPKQYLGAWQIWAARLPG